MKKILLYVLPIVFFCGSCIEPYDFEVPSTTQLLVIDASFTNELKVQEVYLSLSYGLDASEPQPVSGASVVIREEGGRVFNLVEIMAGTYQTPDPVAGTVGLQYQLEVTTENATYASGFETMQAPVPIESIYGRYTTKASNSDGSVANGIQFFVDTKNEQSAYSNYRYAIEEDYEVRVPYPSLYEYAPNDQWYIKREESIAICYQNRPSNEIRVVTTSGLSANRIEQYALVFVEEYNSPLNYKYSLTLRQFSISDQAYQYYKLLKQNNESSGGFADKQKGFIAGNITNIEDPSAPVLGYFEVAGVTERYEIYLPTQWQADGFSPVDPLNRSCNYNVEADTIPMTDINSNPALLNGKNIYQLAFPFTNQVILMPINCTDCTIYGSLTKPDFWN